MADFWWEFKRIFCEVDFLCEHRGYGDYDLNWLGWFILAWGCFVALLIIVRILDN